MEITPNFEEIKEEYPVVEAGVYPARIIDITSDVGWESEPAVKVTFEIFGDKFVGNRLWWNKLAVDGKGAKKFQHLVRAALGELPAAGSSFNTDALLGREVRVLVVNKNSDDGATVWANVKSVTAL